MMVDFTHCLVGPNMNKELNFAEVQLRIGKIFFLVPML